MTNPHTSGLPANIADACRSRMQRLGPGLSSAGVSALLIASEPDIRYLTGFPGEDTLLLITPEQAWIITDPRQDEYLNPWRVTDGFEVVMGVRHQLVTSLKELMDGKVAGLVGIQAEHLSVARYEGIAGVVGADRLVKTTSVVAGLRMRKDPLEIQAIQRSIAVQEDALAAALKRASVGMSEVEFCAILEFEMRWRGAAGPSFAPIIGAGANSSVIHHTPGPGTIQEGMLLIDWGAIVDGYCSDQTRTFAVGAMPKRMAEVYEIVLEAQLAAIEACAPGKTCAEIDAVARSIIEGAGYGEFFGHGLGHSLGLEIHESPYFNDLETETRLEPGMVMTVEPGIYLPGEGGVRIEDDVLITEEGHRVLTSWPKSGDDMLLDLRTNNSAPVGVA